jgi:hypothetical protein
MLMLRNIKSYITAQRRKLPLRIGVFLVLFSCCSIVSAANLTIGPSTVTTQVGKTFTLEVLVANNIEAINAVSAEISYPEDALEVLSVSKAGSFMNLWAEEPSFSNTTGIVSLEGVALNPGYSKLTGKVITITLKAKQAGNVSVSVKNAAILANDGNATDVLKTTSGALIYINEPSASAPTVETVVPVITSPTHADSNVWYSRRDATFEWKVPDAVSAIRTVYSDKETDNPSKVYDPPVNNRSFAVDDDGIFYMRVQFKNKSGWGGIATYKFQIDTEAPESLKVSFPDGALTTNLTPSLLVQAEDSKSGLSKITLSIDNGQPVEYVLDASNLYRLSKQSPGNHTVIVNAVDNAGNTSSVSLDYTIQAITPPVITEYSRKVDFDNTFKIVGATYPLSKVEVTLTDKDGKTLVRETTSTEAGVFSLIWGEKLSSGIYEMRARVLDSRGAVSDYTDTRVIEVERMMLVRFGIFVMNWLSVILIIIIAVLVVLATLWYSFLQFRRFRRKVRRNLREVENTLQVNVAALRRDIEEFHDILVKAERKRELTKEEQAILKKFKKRIEITEKEIEKKLEAAI